VDTAQDGATALELVEHNAYGLAIIDYSMPGMNGVELFRRLRELRPDLAGIFLTGYTTIDVVYPAIEAGILHVLPKPADFRELIAIVQEQVGSAV
jgi:YesN/AraC family two-component response regulator